MTAKGIVTSGVEASGDNQIHSLAKAFQTLYGASMVATEPMQDSAAAMFALVPEGRELVSIEEHYEERRNGPRFHKGRADLFTVESLVKHVERFKRAGTAVFVGIKPDGSGIVRAILDHDEPETPRHRRWEGTYTPELSKAWKAWTGAQEKWMSQSDFAAFLEDRIVDVCMVPADDPLQAMAETLGASFATPIQVLSASRNLEISVSQEVVSAVTLETGEVQVAFKERHNQKAGAVAVPRMFAIAIPLWNGGATYRVAVRLRYRQNGGAVTWNVAPYQTERVIEHAATALTTLVESECAKLSVPVFRGVMS